MQHGAGDARELRAVDLAIGFMGASELLAASVQLIPECRLEKQPLDPAGIAVEQGSHGSEPADPQQLSLVRWANQLRRAFIARVGPDQTGHTASRRHARAAP